MTSRQAAVHAAHLSHTLGQLQVPLGVIHAHGHDCYLVPKHVLDEAVKHIHAAAKALAESLPTDAEEVP